MNIGNDFRQNGYSLCTLADLSADRSLADELAAWYVAVFNAKGEREWGEAWTPESAYQKLFVENRDAADRTFVAALRTDGQLAGVTVTCIDELASAIRLHDLPPPLRTAENLAAVHDRVAWVGDTTVPIAYFREMGIRREFRGGIRPVLDLLVIPARVALSRGAAFSCCWTNRSSRIYDLIAGLDIRLIHAFGDPDAHVVMGDDLGHVVRRFTKAEPEIVARLRASAARA